MRKLLLTILVFSAISAFGQAKSGAKAEGPPSKALMAKVLAALSTGDPTKAARFYDQAPGNVFYDMAPLQYKGWAEYESGLKQVLAGFEYLKLTVHDDAAVHRSGEWAWATATWSGDGKMKNGNKLDLEGRWTVVWQRKSGKWLIVHEHVSVPWSPPSEKRER